jgi:uncharacterized protein
MIQLLFIVLCSCLENTNKVLSEESYNANETTQKKERLLIEAWKNRDPAYVPRTKFIKSDGTPKYINELFLETSPYLKQHAHNPVNWRSWNDQALDEAIQQKKMIFLSIGYSTCHWCHVMEEESFEDEQIAAYLNEHYIPIKVDREERPDIDSIYMKAVTIMTGRGGWPMSVWLTPTGNPIYAATYIPARTGDRGSRKGFLPLLQEINQIYQQDPTGLEKDAKQVRQKMVYTLSPKAPENYRAEEIIESALSQSQSEFDPIKGGRKGKPKFPSSFSIPFLLQQSQYKHESAMKMVTKTLHSMASGGIYDHIGGGFHRYSVDENWMIPHFEKMLYDNAQLANDYLRAEQLFAQQGFGDIAIDILDYLLRDMQSECGGFYSATDADSIIPSGSKEEGYYFSWTPSEIKLLLGSDSAEFFRQFNITKGGNFEGRNVPYSTVPISIWLEQNPSHKEWRKKLFVERQKRPSPLTDKKILTAWNGLALSSFSRAAMFYGYPRYRDAAMNIVDCIENKLVKDDRLFRSYAEGSAKHIAYVEDHAFYITGLLDLFEVTQNPKYLSLALRWDLVTQKQYEDSNGGWYRTPASSDTYIVREMPKIDKAEPSGASYMTRNLLRMYALTSDDSFRQRADLAFKRYAKTLRNSPLLLDDMLIALDWKLHPPKEIIIAVKEMSDATPFIEHLQKTKNNYVLIILHEKNKEKLQKLLPITANKNMKNEYPTAYVCQNGVCQFPVTNISEYISLITQTP